MGAEILTSDDADALKSVADQVGLSHQLCRAHVTKNVLRLVGKLGAQARVMIGGDGSVTHRPPPLIETLATDSGLGR